MPLWNLIATDFNSLDETINFGTRAFAESDDCIYETSTLATIDPDDKVTEFPNVTTFSNPGGQFYVAVNQCMTAFSGESPLNVLFTQVYDSKVSLLSCTPDGNFLFVGLQKGTLLCMHSATSEKIFSLDSSELFTEKGNFVDIIYHKYCTFVINSAGCICKISGIGCKNLDANRTTSLSCDPTKEVTCEKVATECLVAPVRSVSYKLLNDDFVLIAVGNGAAVWTEQYGWDELVKDDKILNLKKVQFFSNDTIAFALSTSGELLQVCAFTLTVEVVEMGDKLADFLVVGTPGHERVVAITLGGDQKTALLMLNVPGFEGKLRMNIGWPSRLISLGDEEDILFLEFLEEDDSVGLAIKSAVQTNPYIRLERLLTRGKFDAALQLAQSFNLVRTSIYQTMAKNVVERLQPWKFAAGKSSDDSHRLYEELVSLLDKIEDTDFICQCCLNVISSEFEVSRNILQYAQKRISAFSLHNPEEESKVAHLSNAICSSLLKLETMALIEPVWDAEKWLQFNKIHPLDEVDKRLQQGQMSEAAIVWNRHQSESQEILENERDLNKLLDIIPPWVSLDAMMMWLKQLLPAVLSKQPTGVSKLVDWIIPKIKALEKVSGGHWPDVGLRYVKELQSYLTSEHKKWNSHEMQSSAVRHLAVLIDALTELSELKKTYGVMISLNDYLEDDHEEVAYALLGKLDEKYLLAFLDNFLLKFINHRQLEYDTVLTKYVERILRRSLGWWMWQEAPWEKCIVTLLSKIGNCEMRLGCILLLLDEAPVPWSPSITKMVNDVAGLNHPLAAKIREKRKQIAVNMLAKKYNIKSAIKNIHTMQLVRLIIKRSLPSMALDIEQLVNSTESKTFVDLCVECVQVFYENGKYEDARIYLYKLEDETAVVLCGVLMEDYYSNLSESNEDLLAKIGFYAIIEHRLKEALSQGNDCTNFLENARRIRNKMVLQVEFPTVNREKAVKSKRQRFLDYIEQLLRDEKSENYLPRMKRVADLISMPQEEALVVVAEQACQSNKMELAISAANEVIDSPTTTLTPDPDIGFCLNNLVGALLSNCQGKTNQTAVEAAYQISVLAIQHSPVFSVQVPVDLFGWARTWRCLSHRDADTVTHSGDIFQERRFSELYCDSELCGFLDFSEMSQFLQKFFVHYESGKEIDVAGFLVSLERVTQQLQENQRDLAVLALTCHLHCLFAGDDPKTNVLIEGLLSKVVTTLLPKVLNSRQLDYKFAVSLLSFLGKDASLNLLSSVKSSHLDLKKQSSLSKLGVTVSELWRDHVSLAEFQKDMISSTWSSRLPEYNISAKDLFYNGESPTEVLKKLLCAPNVTVDAIKSFCDDYNCDFQAALLLHLESVLLSWDPDLVVRVRNDGTRLPVVQNTEEQLWKKCNEIIQRVVDLGPVKKMLLHIWHKINLYYHEVFLVVLQILHELDAAVSEHYEKCLLLRFLKSYHRRKPADFDEENSWSEHFSTSSSLPTLAEFRLPHSRLIYNSNSSVVTPEVTLQSYSTWLTVAAALNFDLNKMRVVAVRQSVSEEFANQQNVSELWCTSIKYNALYEAVKQCVAGMTDLMTASACLYFFVNKIPPGADQLMAAKLCLEYTERLAESKEFADKLEKVQNKYLNLATKHVLHVCGLGDPQYLQLVGSPEKLLKELYQHPAIIDYCLGNSAHCPNINGAVEKIGELHNIVIHSLQVDLLRDWLQSYYEANGDSSLDEYTTTLRSKDECRNDKTGVENLMRARYVMEDGDKKGWVNYLNRLAVASHVEVNPTVRLRALRCMLMLTDSETVESLSNKDMATLRELQRCLEYVAELELLGFACSEKSFQNHNKEELATVVLRSQAHRPRALRLVARLCLDYDVQQTSVWRTLLKQFTQLGMYEDLGNILPSLTKLYHLWSTSEFIEAWNSLVITPFTEADHLPSQPQITAMLSAVEQLSNCPILDKISTQKAVDVTLKMKIFELTALLLPFCEKSSRSDIRKVILELANLTMVEEELSRICSHSPLNVKQTMDYLRNAVE